MTPSFKSVIIKVTNECNLQCKYCFVSDSVPRRTVINEAIVELLLKELERVSSEETIHLVWHGGEPTLAGGEFFCRVKALQAGREKRFENYIQTNGTLITDELIETLHNNGFNIGLSLDGPSSLNDQNRIDRNGAGSFQRVSKAIQKLRKRGIFSGILATIAKHNVDRAEELYNFCREQEIRLKLSPLYRAGRAIHNIDALAITPEEYTRFLNQLAGLWLEDARPVFINPIEALFLGTFAGSKIQRDCSFTANCHREFFAIGPTGDLYPCGLFQGLEEFKYGNIFDMAIDEIKQTAVFARLEHRSEAIASRCQPCDLYEICYGGCPFQALTGTGDLNKEAPQCTPYREVISEMLDQFHEKVKKLRVQKSASNQNCMKSQ